MTKFSMMALYVVVFSAILSRDVSADEVQPVTSWIDGNTVYTWKLSDSRYVGETGRVCEYITWTNADDRLFYEQDDTKLTFQKSTESCPENLN